MNELIQYFETLLLYTRTNAPNLNVASQRALAEFIAQFQEFITQFIQDNPVDGMPPSPPPGGGQPDLEPAMPSSNVSAFSYDDENDRLLVQFLGQFPNRQGPTYSYEGVPKEIFELFQSGAVPARTDGKNKWGKWWKGKVPSIGASLYTLIKNRAYPYQRVA